MPQQQSLKTFVSRRQLLAAGSFAMAGFDIGATPRMVLTVAAFPLVDQIAKAALPAWNARYPNVEVRIQSRQYADHHTAMTTALSTSVLLPDVMVLESSFVGRFSEGGGLDDLRKAPYEVAQFRDRIVPYAYDQAVNKSGAVVAMPTDIGPGTLLYRKDILERAGVAESDLTSSWESYLDAGRQIKAKTGAHLVSHVQSIKDILIRSGIQPGEGLYFDQDSNVLVTSPRFVRAFEIAKQARHYKLDARVSSWSNEWAEGLKRGTLSTELSGAWMVGQMSNWVAPTTTGLWRATQLPQGAAVAYGGAFYAIPRRSNPSTKALAWEFIQMMTLDRERQLAAFKSQDAFPALRAAHDDPFFDAPVAFLGGQPARRLWRESAQRIAAVKVHKQSSFADEVIGTELDKVLNRDKNIQLALADAHRLLAQRAHR